MREIKFRGKDIDKRLGWHYGFYFKEGNKAYIFENGKTFQVDSETIGEFTGLRDKKKKEIYEGDLIKIDGILHEVEWSEEEVSFYAYELYGGDSYYFGRSKDEIIIVGNVYENPKLLEEAKV